MSVARKGATTRSQIPTDVLQQLNAGVLETATLAEGLAIDFVVLVRHVFPAVADQAALCLKASDGITKQMSIVGKLLLEELGQEEFYQVAVHPSDTVRGWAAFLLAEIPHLSLQERLNLVRSLADDAHFGVREWAWLALRPHLASQIQDAIELLIPWTTATSANVRRFAVESTRPRGVWCSHISVLKQNPEMGLPLLEPVKADTSRYVQDSVSNWLNDAAKTSPDWVQQLCNRWQQESSVPETVRICKRSLRSLKA